MKTTTKTIAPYSLLDFENAIAEAVALLDLVGNAYGQFLAEEQKDGETNALGLQNIRFRTIEKLKGCSDSAYHEICSLGRQLADAKRAASGEAAGPSQN